VVQQMTKRKRATWSVEEREAAVAIARVHGAAAAAEQLAIAPGTVRSWVARASERPVSADDPAADVQMQRVDSLSVDEWRQLQRTTERRYRAALANGKPSDARWLAVCLGVVTDKLAKAREAAPDQADDVSVARSLLDVIERECPDVVRDADRMRDLEAQNAQLWARLDAVPVGVLATVDDAQHDATAFAAAPYLVLDHLRALCDDDEPGEVAAARPFPFPKATRLTFAGGRMRRLHRHSVQRRIGGPK
jgi:transposase-like protein